MLPFRYYFRIFVFVLNYHKTLILILGKMKKLLIITFYFISSVLTGQKFYTPEWESLDTRPIPHWFENAKFGIFIHWGLYSVPMWSPKGTYSEWYKYWSDQKTLFGNGDFSGTEVYDYHRKMYGEDFTYADFAPLFKALCFDADKWTDIFVHSGAKYIILTTKHHEGFALWPSNEASKSYGRPWNSMEIGAHRDLVGEYVNALRKTNLKVGFYFSLREWDNPLYNPETMSIFYERHFFPQLKDLVNRYKPDLIWADGPDSMDDKIWQVERTLSWLYSESPVKDSIVINDRWAVNTGGRHGDYYTKEYSNTNNSSTNKPWEECRGIGFSFGLNQNEDLEDYTSPQALILTLVNVVSQGGNLLLGIGPNANGKIPPIMQERLLQIGNWLNVNGEAIYGTHTWKHPFQWSKGNREWKPKGKHYVSGNEILKQTINPEPGYAVKEIFFTQKGNNIFAILPKYPKTEIILKGIKTSNKTKISILGSEKKILWKQKGDNIIIKMPFLYYDEMPCDYAWTLKLQNIL